MGEEGKRGLPQNVLTFARIMYVCVDRRLEKISPRVSTLKEWHDPDAAINLQIERTTCFACIT